MAIVTEVQDGNIKTLFPKLMRGKISGSIYLMTSDGHGTRVHIGVGAGNVSLGVHSSSLGMECLEDFHGDVCLRGE